MSPRPCVASHLAKHCLKIIDSATRGVNAHAVGRGRRAAGSHEEDLGDGGVGAAVVGDDLLGLETVAQGVDTGCGL